MTVRSSFIDSTTFFVNPIDNIVVLNAITQQKIVGGKLRNELTGQWCTTI